MTVKVGPLRFVFERCPCCGGHGFDLREFDIIIDTVKIPFVDLMHALMETIENKELVRYLGDWDQGHDRDSLYCQMCHGMGYIRIGVHSS